MKAIKLKDGSKTFVDDDDYEFLSQWKWKKFGGGYVARTESVRNKKKIIWMHRIIMNTPDSLVVDHIDHNPLNNQKKNLRNCTKTQNGRNRIQIKNGLVDYKGVTIEVHKKSYSYAANISVNNKNIRIGSFKTAEDAARAYDIAAIKYFGEFANLNFKTEDYENNARMSTI